MWSILFVIYCCINTGFANHQNLVPSKILIQEIWSERQPTKRIGAAKRGIHYKRQVIWSWITTKDFSSKITTNEYFSFTFFSVLNRILFSNYFIKLPFVTPSNFASFFGVDMKNNKTVTQFRISVNVLISISYRRLRHEVPKWGTLNLKKQGRIHDNWCSETPLKEKA